MTVKESDVRELREAPRGQMKLIPDASGGWLRLRLVKGVLEVIPLTRRDTIKVEASGIGASPSSDVEQD